MGQSIGELFETLVPQARELSEEQQEVFLNLAAAQIDKSIFGGVYRQALCYLAGHFMIMSRKRDGVGGALTGRRAGEVSENYGDPMVVGQGTLSSTSYGIMYRQLQRSRVGTMATVSGGKHR